MAIRYLGRRARFLPERVLLPEFTWVPAVIALAAQRDALVELEVDPSVVNPSGPSLI